MAPGQTLQAVVDVVQRFLKQGGVLENIVEVQVEQSDACGRTDACYCCKLWRPIITEVRHTESSNLILEYVHICKRQRNNKLTMDPSFSMIFKAKTPQILWFQLLKLEYFQYVLVFYGYEINVGMNNN